SKRGIAMVFQSYALYPHMSCAENMGFALKLAGTPKAEIDERVKKAAEILEITHLLERKPKALSGGQRQRVAIGRAIVRNPKVFLFDEPLSNLDAALRLNMRVELSKLHQELKTTMIYVTHDQVEAMTLADRIVVFHAGLIQQVGTPLDMYDNPSNLFVAGFLGSPKMNLLEAEVVAASGSEATVKLPKGLTVRAAVDASTARVGDKVTMGVRSEHIRLVEAGTPDALPARVDLIEHLGDIVLAYIEIPGIHEILCMKLPGHMTGLKYGDAIHIVFPQEHTMLFDAEGLALPRVGQV
uniref:ABC transporter ATP-binding protein n=1 Tax=Chitinilyticum litopenaei TaxID=1121276 RepID=UPI0005BACEFC